MTHYFHDIDPIALQLPAFNLFGAHFQPAIHWYGVMYLLAFVAAWWLGSRRARAGRLPGVDAQAYGDLMFYAMLGVVLGGRLWYMLTYVSPSWIVHDPAALLRVWDGGMSFHGGLIGVLVACLWWSRRHRLHIFDTVDFIAPLAPPGLFFGRFGNFINGELWGKQSDVPWAVIFPKGITSGPYQNASVEQLRALAHQGALEAWARHPSQLYEASLEGLVMFVVLFVYSSKPRPRYAVSGWFALLYGCFRFAVEFVRVPDEQLGYLAFGWLTMGQVQSLPLVVLGLVLLWMSRKAPVLEPIIAAPPDAKAEAGAR
ncbi:MAG TPA: prolipoprotein diacylglyceryl transferase [Xanthomonadaceae bacterium]|jgi:phosphatidylglycerol:prolipoprotein diacylglycerol transferase